jgi:hypothetical protein
MMAEIRPTQFSALKVFHHPHEKEECSEDDDGYADDQEVIHGAPSCYPRGAGIARRGARLTAARTP